MKSKLKRIWSGWKSLTSSQKSKWSSRRRANDVKQKRSLGGNPRVLMFWLFWIDLNLNFCVFIWSFSNCVCILFGSYEGNAVRDLRYKCTSWGIFVVQILFWLYEVRISNIFNFELKWNLIVKFWLHSCFEMQIV